MTEFPTYKDVADYLEAIFIEEALLGATEGDDPDYFRERKVLHGLLMVDAEFIPITEGPEVLL